MIKAMRAQAPFVWVIGDRVEWIGIHPVMVTETEHGVQKTLIDPRTVQPAEELAPAAEYADAPIAQRADRDPDKREPEQIQLMAEVTW